MARPIGPPPAAAPSWRAAAAPYQRPTRWQSIWQIVNSFVPYILLWYAMYRSLSVSYWLTLGLAVLAGGFLVRIFIILHDCGHGSFFSSKAANEAVGVVCGVFTFTPFYQWRHDHAMHHATSGDLDRRGYGDVQTLTVDEYLAMPRWEQFKYCTFRHPLAMLLAGPIYSFLVIQRFVLPTSGPRERGSVHLTNITLVCVLLASWATIGLRAYALVQLPIVFVAGLVAIWLFYCQHQFEGTYWARHEEWDFERSALEGASYFQLPRVLQWFTGNIGFHHVHHLSPRIPNYNLEACHNAHPRFQEATMITIRSSVGYFALKMWDEQEQRLVPLRELHDRAQRPRQSATPAQE